MNLYHLRYFVTLAHLEHYTKAAEELLITQPSLSHAISTLEQELGVRLFEKSGRNITLTKYGKAFLTDVEHSLHILDASVNSLKMASGGEGIIDLAFLRTLGTDLIPKLVRGFLQTHPDKNIQFRLSGDSGLTPDLISGLKDRKYDIAFCSKAEGEPLIEFTPIARQELVVIVPKEHPLSDRNEICLSETLPYPQIIFSKRSGLRTLIDSLFFKVGGYPQVVYEVDEDQVVAGLVAYDFGIAVVPNMPLLDRLNIKVLHIKSPNWERNFYMAVLKDAYQAPVLEKFKQYVIDSSNL